MYIYCKMSVIEIIDALSKKIATLEIFYDSNLRA